MGIDFEAIDKNGETMIYYSIKWLRDWAPRELFWDADIHKDILYTDDLKNYRKIFQNYIEGLRFVKGNEDDDEDYDKWVSENKLLGNDDYQFILRFIKILDKCINNNWTASWSY